MYSLHIHRQTPDKPAVLKEQSDQVLNYLPSNPTFNTHDHVVFFFVFLLVLLHIFKCTLTSIMEANTTKSDQIVPKGAV